MLKGQIHPAALRSKKLISDSLMQLMEKSSFETITIHEITDQAELTRRTFYAHFASKNEVIQFQLEQLNQDLINRIQSEKTTTHQLLAITYFRFWMNHVDLLTQLKKNQLLPLLFDTFEAQIEEIRDLFGCQASAGQNAHYRIYSSAFFTGILWNMLNKWITTGASETPEELVYLLTAIIDKFSVAFKHQPASLSSPQKDF